MDTWEQDFLDREAESVMEAIQNAKMIHEFYNQVIQALEKQVAGEPLTDREQQQDKWDSRNWQNDSFNKSVCYAG